MKEPDIFFAIGIILCVALLVLLGAFGVEEEPVPIMTAREQADMIERCAEGAKP